MRTPGFDLQKAHRYFASLSFNNAWDLMIRAKRTVQENDEMLRLSHASLWHWTQFSEHTSINLSVGNWQLSRIYSLLSKPEEAERFAKISLKLAEKDCLGPFFRAYGHEALARAGLLSGKHVFAEKHLQKAFRLAKEVVAADDKNLLIDDLERLQSMLPS